MLNSVISRKGAWFSTIDIRNFYLHTPMVDPEYIRIKITDIPHSWNVHLGVWARQKRRPQWADLLWNTMWLLWFTLSWYTGQRPPLWMFRKRGLLQSRYHTKPLETQMAANPVLPHRQYFGIKYVGIKHFNHLVVVLQWYHQVQTNMTGNKIAGLNVQWDFPSKQVCIDMKSYVNNLLLSLNWPMPKKPQLLPFTATPITYGQKIQYTPDKDT